MAVAARDDGASGRSGGRGKPSVIAIDVLFAEADTRSPAALARQLGALTGSRDLNSLAAGLPDGDKRLAAAIRSVPATLGFVLDADNANAVPGVPVLARHPVALDGVWRMTGGIAPYPLLIDATKGLGALSLPGDADGKIRRVPLLVGAGEATRPGLALEAVRLARQSPAYSVELRTATDHRWRPRSAAAERWSAATGRRRCGQTCITHDFRS